MTHENVELILFFLHLTIGPRVGELGEMPPGGGATFARPWEMFRYTLLLQSVPLQIPGKPNQMINACIK